MRGKDGPKFKYTPETMQDKLDEYFNNTPVEDITLTGVCIHLGIYKDTFYNYGRRDGFTDMINMARMKIENSYEVSLKRYGRAGDIFALKNFGWRDKQEVSVEHSNFGDVLNKFVEKL